MKTLITLFTLMLALQSCSLTHNKPPGVLEPPAIDIDSDAYEYKTYTEDDAVKYWPETHPQERAKGTGASPIIIMLVGGTCALLDGLLGYEKDDVESFRDKWPVCEEVWYWDWM